MADYSDLKNRFKTDDVPTGDDYEQLISLAGDAKDKADSSVTDNGDGSIMINNKKVTPASADNVVIDNKDNTITVNNKVYAPVIDNQDGTITVNTQRYTPADYNKVVIDNKDGSITYNNNKVFLVKDNKDGSILINGKSYVPSDKQDTDLLSGKIENLSSSYNKNTLSDGSIYVGYGGSSLSNVIKNRRPISEKIGVHAWSYKFSQDNISNDGIGFKLISEHGFKYVRMGISWSASEPTEGSYNIDDAQSMVSMAIENQLIPIITISSDVPTEYQEDTYDNNLPRFIKFYQYAIDKLKNLGIYWEGINEPNGSISWFKSQSDTDDFQAKLSDVTHKMALITKSLDPSSHFISGAVATNIWKTGTNQWQTFYQKAMTNKIDLYSEYISHHPYILANSPSFYYGSDSQIIYLNNMIKNYSSTSKQAITEVGWTTTDADNPTTESDKAVRLLQTIFIADQLNVDIICVFSWHELSSDDQWGQQNPAEVGYGIISSDLRTDLEASSSIKEIISRLDGYTYDFSETSTNNDFVLHYTNFMNNKHKIVYWSFDGDYHTNGSTNTTVSLPSDTIMAPKPQIYDID
ncbi:glycosyl hydrolase [Lactobacillus phage Bacchae]|uniref:Glycosyl hydrolase n=1 Tax=Lactobacillus phage Bacchae TaxID=2079429 RepID=A0A2K9VCN9_9CAUD|nr:glycosyl hydrolase [Lactobacillus phage Bacchae]AUV59991.1 glycosyl hydrolase [Lactobacillus phage Bacchae]